jgi:hypothetical protein
MVLRTAAAHHFNRLSVSTPRLLSSLSKSKQWLPSNNSSSAQAISLRALATAAAGAESKPGEKKKEMSDYFLDNLGTIFLGTIGAIFLSLVRSSYGTTNKNNIRDDLEEKSALDPLEMDDLRIANSELDTQVFRSISQGLKQEFSSGRATYPEVVKSVRATMASLKGPAFTIELGHLVDRAVIGAFEEKGMSQEEDMPLSFWIAILSMALHSTSNDRIRLLYEGMQVNDEAVTFAQVQEMIGHLQVSSQLVPDSQVIMSEQKYPIQQYHRGTPKQLVEYDGNMNDPIDVAFFADILRSNSVCAWGECYLRKKPTMETNNVSTVNNP